jgi:hypothetical protein
MLSQAVVEHKALDGAAAGATLRCPLFHRLIEPTNWLFRSDHAMRGHAYSAQPGGGLVAQMEITMFKALLSGTALLTLVSATQAQVMLSTYADKNGYVDVQKLTCKQLANTFQEDADYLTVWYSGWYNGLAKKHLMKVDRAKELEHEVIVYCKANSEKKVIQAIDTVFKKYRADKGIKVN